MSTDMNELQKVTRKMLRNLAAHLMDGEDASTVRSYLGDGKYSGDRKEAHRDRLGLAPEELNLLSENGLVTESNREGVVNKGIMAFDKKAVLAVAGWTVDDIIKANAAAPSSVISETPERDRSHLVGGLGRTRNK